MTEHETLKAICDKIWYDNIHTYWCNNQYQVFKTDIRSAREIIFTQEFMDKFLKEYRKEELTIEKSIYRWHRFTDLIYKHLDNPVEYLYNLIK